MTNDTMPPTLDEAMELLVELDDPQNPSDLRLRVADLRGRYEHANAAAQVPGHPVVPSQHDIAEEVSANGPCAIELQKAASDYAKALRTSQDQAVEEEWSRLERAAKAWTRCVERSHTTAVCL